MTPGLTDDYCQSPQWRFFGMAPKRPSPLSLETSNFSCCSSFLLFHFKNILICKKTPHEGRWKGQGACRAAKAHPTPFA